MKTDINFGLYKSRLIEYLQLMGIPAKRGVISCISPNHPDKNPSCEIFDENFCCYSGNCSVNGDIYDAVELLEGITNKVEQFKHLESLFGGNHVPVSLPVPETEKTVFVPEPAACAQFEKYLLSNTAAKKEIRRFLNIRAYTASHKAFPSYPDDIIENLVNFFFYWPGLEVARKEVGTAVLHAVGIPLKENQATGLYSWGHSGVVLKLGSGYKLHFYTEGICEKRGSKGCCTFPMPGSINPAAERIILVEGEMDADVAAAAGIENIFSAGGTNGLTGPKIKKYLLKVKEIVLLFDNDPAGRKASGRLPYIAQDKRRASIPETLKKAGYPGIIRIAQLEKYKDPDDAILNRHTDLVIKAIENAQEWTAPVTADSMADETAPGKDSNAAPGRMDLTLLNRFLAKVPAQKLEKSELALFISAIANGVPEYTAEIREILRTWGASDELLKKTGKQPASYLVKIAKKYELSYYFIKKIEAATLSKNDLQKMTVDKEVVTEINFDELKNDINFKNFIFKRGEKSAANLLAKILKNKLIYIETKNKFYLYNKHVWEREPDMVGIIYDIFSAILKHYIGKLKGDEDSSTLKNLKSTLNKIEERRFRVAILKDLSGMNGIFYDDLTFDGPQIQETLTLADGVLDFSDKKIVFRSSQPEEFRKKKLDYTVDAVKNSTDPKKFLSFMKGNFKNDDTLQTLMYYLSLLPSRRAQFKVGGIFVGITNTGKTTTMKIISDIYTDMTTPIPREMIMTEGYKTFASSGPNPFLSRLEGMGAGISDETKRNDQLNAALWKQLTGGGKLTARGIYANPRDFMPTAQIIILTNYSPRFDGKDQATIDRMVVVPFTVQHNHAKRGTKEENTLLAELRPEYPAVVKLFAEYYINLKHKFHGKIPLSKECESYKNDYVEDQATDLDRFVSENIEFVKDADAWVPLKDVYVRYCKYNDIELDEFGKPRDKESWSQSKFTRFLKTDYIEVHIKQKKINGYPEQIVINMRLKDIANKKEAIQGDPAGNPPPPDENPF